LIDRFQYRPEVDGLRAVAVAVVVLFHADFGVPGGFIGVDVFFVISGYLISSLILKDLEANTFSFGRFWERRVRRILPAAVVSGLATIVAGWYLLFPSHLARLGASAASQAVFAANFFFWRNVGYFSGPADEEPLLHTWSLAVEEQFYLFFPLLLAGVFRIGQPRRRVAFLVTFLVGSTLSLTGSAYAVHHMPGAAFYLLPTRVWELLSGAIVAILAPPSRRCPRWVMETLAWVGLAAVLAPSLAYTKATPFPGLAALPPCLGTALVIWVTNVGEAKNVSVARMLAIPGVVFLGLVSYSLYLWHWPLIAFAKYWALEPLTFWHRAALLALAFGLAVASWRYVETPFRSRRVGLSRASVFALGGLGLAAMGTCGLALRASEGVPGRFSARTLALRNARQEALRDPRIPVASSLARARAGDFPRLGEPGPVRVLVWGDSHARSILPAFGLLADENHTAVLSAWHSQTAPVLEYRSVGRDSLGSESSAFNQAVFDFLGNHPVPDVVLAARWSGYLASGTVAPGTDRRPTQFAKALARTVAQLTRAGKRVWILLEVPMHRVNVPKALAHRDIFGTDLRELAADRDSYERRLASMSRLTPDLEAEGARVIDVSPCLLEPGSGRFLMEQGGLALYYDSHHLAVAGAQVVSPCLRPVFDDAGVPGNADGRPAGS
jgi:peptidoglycan/LPS O-acetylase OafA/YrhL